MVKRFIGSGREQEGGAGATRKQDFNAHVTGGDWRHEADQIDVVPEVLGTSNVQSALETLAAGLGGAFVIIGDGFDGCTGDFSTAFNNAFADPDLSDGGTIIVKSGSYCMQSTVFVPNGISIIGDKGGSTIIGEMSETPMFSFAQATVKNDIQPSVIPMDQFDDQNYLGGLKLYDNLNGSVASGGPSMSAVPMLQIQHGANLVIEDCNFIGRAVTGPVSVTSRVVGFTGLTSAGIGTTLHVNKCYIDGVKTAIDFDARQGDLDYLTVTNNRARTFGDGGLGTVDDRFFIALVNCNATITDNYHKGLSAIWGSEGCILIKDITIVNNQTSMNLQGNYGGLDQPGSNDFLVDLRTIKDYIKIINVNNWGIHHSDTFEIFNTDDTFNVSGNVSVSENVNVLGKIKTSQLAVAPGEYLITDADNGSITITYPYPSNIKIIADPGLTASTSLIVIFEGEPDDGELLVISVIQPQTFGASTTGRITNLSFGVVGSALSPGFSSVIPQNTDFASCSPHTNVVSHFTFRYLGETGNYYYVKTGECETAINGSDFIYDQLYKTFDSPQKSASVMDGTWVPISSGVLSSFNYPSSNPVYMDKNVSEWRNGAAIWAGVATSGNIIINVLRPDSSLKTFSITGSFGSSLGSRLVIREADISDSGSAAFLCGLDGNVYRIIATITGPVFSSFSAALLGSWSGGLVYKDRYDDNFYWGDGSNVMRQFGPGGGAPAVSTTFTGPAGSITDISRNLDGNMFAITQTGYYKISTSGLGVSPVWGAEANYAFTGTAWQVVWDRLNNRWLVITTSGEVYHSTDVNASAWVFLNNLPNIGVRTFVQAVGNSLVASAVSVNDVSVLYSNDGGNSWSAFRSDSGLATQNQQVGGFCYLGGYLMASTSAQTSSSTAALISQSKCNRWGPLDIDK